MAFIGCNIMRKGGSKIYQPFKAQGGVGPLCGFSTYFNGTTEENVDFVYRAPLHLEEDSVSNETAVVDWTTSGLLLTLDAKIIFSEQNTNSRYIRHEKMGETNSLASISYSGTSAEARYYLRDSSGTNPYQYNLDLTELEVDQFQLEFDVAAGKVRAYADGALKNEQSWVVTPGFFLIFDKHFISNEDVTLNYATMLLTSYEATGLGKANFVQNQSDGLQTISDNGTIWLITEDVAGSSQIKADGTSSTAYEWPESAKFHMPQTGPTKLLNSYLFAEGFSYDPADLNPMDFDVTINDKLTGNQTIARMTSSDSGASIEWLYLTDSDRIRLIISNGVTVVISQFSTIDPNMVNSFGFITSGLVGAKTYECTVNGIGGGDPETIDLSLITFDKLYIGSSSNGVGTIDQEIKSIRNLSLGYTSFVNRLWPLDSADRYKYQSTQGQSIEYTLTAGFSGSVTELPLSVFPYTLPDPTTFGAITSVGFIGDSLTSSSGPSGGWAPYFTNHFDALGFSGITYDNLAVNGFTAFKIAESSFDYTAYTGGTAPDTNNNINKAVSNGAQCVFIWAGENDNSAGFPINGTIAAIQSAVDYCVANNVVAFVLTVKPRGSTEGIYVTRSNEMSDAIRLMAVTDKVFIVDAEEVVKVVASDPAVLDLAYANEGADPRIHLNPTGLELVGNEVIEVFEDNIVTQAHLVSDTPCTATSGQPEFLLDDDSIALQDDDGEFLYGDI